MEDKIEVLSIDFDNVINSKYITAKTNYKFSPKTSVIYWNSVLLLHLNNEYDENKFDFTAPASYDGFLPAQEKW